jgi:archaellum component FlaF (FlaF/FlaG flagellin family)
MEPSGVAAIIWVVALVMVGLLFRSQRGRRKRVGAAAAGAIYDMLNEDRRNAIEIIVEEKAAACDPEDRDGNLPDLAQGRGTTQTR